MGKLKTKKEFRDYAAAAQSIDDSLNERNQAYTEGSFKILRLFLHLIAALQFLYALYYYIRHVKLPKPEDMSEEEFENMLEQDFGGKLKFLTFLDLILQAVYQSIALLNDCFGSNFVAETKDKLPWLRRLRDWLFTSLAFPISFNVCLSFWFMYAIDRELVFPKKLDAIFPNALNHVVHTNVAMLALLDMFTCFREFPHKKTGALSTLVFMILYVIWLSLCRYLNGHWAYPVFDVAPVLLSTIMLIGMIALSVILYFIGEFINNKIWEPELELLERRKKLRAKSE